jgi:hypothetical protein
MFRNKEKKKKQDNTIITATVDSKHQEKVKYFEGKKLLLPKLKNKLETIKKKLDIIEKKDNFILSEIEKRANLRDSKEELEKEINNIENNVEEMNYYHNTAHSFLIPYYELLEIQENNYEKKEKKSIIEIFNTPNIKKENINTNNSRSSLLNSYLRTTEGKTFKKQRRKPKIKNCPVCQDIELTLHISDGNFTCTRCGYSEVVLLDSDKPNYKDPIPDNSAYAYKRINHFREWLSQFQGRENTDIPVEVYEKVLEELQKNRIHNLAELKPDKMRAILRKTGYNSMYEHIPHIISKINGLPPPNISRETEEKLIKMFTMIQKPFQMYKTKKRKNFLNYSYVLHKFCELLELDQFLPYFPLLKSPENLKEQDAIWKKICNHLHWEFYTSENKSEYYKK